MARYRRFDPRFWKDEKVRTLTLTEKSIAIYGFTAQSNRIGIFSFSPGEACEDLELKPETFAKGFKNVCQTLGWQWEERSRVLYLPTWWKYNPPENANNVIGNLKDLSDVPHSPLISLFSNNLQYLPGTLHQTFTQTFSERYPKRSPSQEQYQEQYQEQVKEPLSDSTKSDAVALLEYLNTKSGHHYRPSAKANLALVLACLTSSTPDEIRSVIDAKVGEWHSDPKMRVFLRPSTLFRPSNFEQYLGQVGSAATPEPPYDPDEIHWRFDKVGLPECLTRRELDAEQKALLELEQVAQ